MISAGRAIGQHDRPADPERAGPVDPRRLLHAGRDRLEELLMMNTPAASASSGTISAGVGVVDPELVDDQELRDQQHHVRAPP